MTRSNSTYGPEKDSGIFSSQLPYIEGQYQLRLAIYTKALALMKYYHQRSGQADTTCIQKGHISLVQPPGRGFYFLVNNRFYLPCFISPDVWKTVQNSHIPATPRDVSQIAAWLSEFDTLFRIEKHNQVT